MFSQRHGLTLFFATVLLVAPAFAGGSRAPALTRVQHGPIVFGDPSPIAKAIGKPVVLYYWDMTCIPCYVHLDAIVDFARDVRRSGGRFFSIHHGTRQTAETLQKFAKKENVPYTIAHGGKGPSSIRALPRMFVFNASGDLVYQGSIGKLAVEAFQAQVKH